MHKLVENKRLYYCISISIADTAPMDFTEVVGEMIDFPSTNCISITIIDDAVPEPNEFFSVLIFETDPAAVLGPNNEATVTITDAEAPVGIELPVYTVGEAAGFVEVCVVAQGQLSQDVTVSLLSQDVSTTSGTGGQ